MRVVGAESAWASRGWLRRVRRGLYIAVPVDARDPATWGEWRGDRKVNVSGRERTVADILSDPALGGGIRHTMEVLNTLLSDAKLEDLVDALERLDNGAAIKRLGYLMEVLGYDTAAVDWPLTSGFPLLDTSLPSGGSRSTRWGLRINADVSA